LKLPSYAGHLCSLGSPLISYPISLILLLRFSIFSSTQVTNPLRPSLTQMHIYLQFSISSRVHFSLQCTTPLMLKTSQKHEHWTQACHFPHTSHGLTSQPRAPVQGQPNNWWFVLPSCPVNPWQHGQRGSIPSSCSCWS